MTLCGHRDANDGLDIARGLLRGLLLAIPLWTMLGIVPFLVVQDGAIDESTSLALMIAAVCGSILARPYQRVLWAKFKEQKILDLRLSGRDAGMRTRARPASRHNDQKKSVGQGINSIEDLLRSVEPEPASRPRPRRAHVAPSLFRQSLALSALAGAYLQYYFMEVNLQISSLNSFTVFLPVASIT